MGCSGSKTATKAGKKAAPVVTEASAPAEAVEEAEAKTADAEKAEEAKVEEAEKAIGDLRESELKLSADKADAKAEDGDTVTTATKEESPRFAELKIEAADAPRGPCVCGSLW